MQRPAAQVRREENQIQAIRIERNARQRAGAQPVQRVPTSAGHRRIRCVPHCDATPPQIEHQQAQGVAQQVTAVGPQRNKLHEGVGQSQQQQSPAGGSAAVGAPGEEKERPRGQPEDNAEAQLVGKLRMPDPRHEGGGQQEFAQPNMIHAVRMQNEGLAPVDAIHHQPVVGPVAVQPPVRAENMRQAKEHRPEDEERPAVLLESFEQLSLRRHRWLNLGLYCALSTIAESAHTARTRFREKSVHSIK